MKRKSILILLTICLFTGCTKTENTTKAVHSAESTQTDTKEGTKESTQPEPPQKNPLSSISSMYADGQKTSKIKGGINKENFDKITTEYADYILEIGDYIDSHQTDFLSGKTFSDFDDYENSFEEFYHWANKLIYYNGNVDADYQKAWERFRDTVNRHITVLESTYKQDGQTALDSILAFLEEVNNTSAEISQLIPIETIELGTTITSKFFELTLNSVELSYDVVPDTTENYYSHYPADPGQVYIHVDADIKNTAKQNLPCDEIYSVTANYNDGYTYNGFNITQEEDGDFTYASITSITLLQTLGVHNLVDCPEEVETSGDPLFIILTLKDGAQYKYTIR